MFLRKIMSLMYFKGITQRELGNKIGVNKAIVSMYFSGKYNLKEEKIKALCKEIGIEYSAFKKKEIAEIRPNKNTKSMIEALDKAEKSSNKKNKRK